MLRHAALSLLVASLIATPAARAERMQLSAGVTDVFGSGGGLDPITGEDAMTRGSVGAAYRIGESEELDLFLFGAWDFGGASGQMFQAIETSLRVQEIMLGLAAEWPILRGRLLGFTRGGLGLARARLRLEERGGGAARMDDHARAVSLSLQTGAELRINPRRANMWLGLRLTGGYYAASRLSFRSGGGGGELGIPRAGADLGELNMSGWTLGMALVARF